MEEPKGTVEREPRLGPRLVKAKDVAKMLNVPLTAIYRYVGNNEIPYYRFGKKTLRFSIAHINQWVNECRVR